MIGPIRPIESMFRCFRAFNGRMQGVCNGQTLHFIPAVNSSGDLYVNVRGKGYRHSVTIEEWAAWAEEFVTELERVR